MQAFRTSTSAPVGLYPFASQRTTVRPIDCQLLGLAALRVRHVSSFMMHDFQSIYDVSVLRQARPRSWKGAGAESTPDSRPARPSRQWECSDTHLMSPRLLGTTSNSAIQGQYPGLLSISTRSRSRKPTPSSEATRWGYMLSILGAWPAARQPSQTILPRVPGGSGSEESERTLDSRSLVVGPTPVQSGPSSPWAFVEAS
ncbi:hypothetical protein C8Q73DRAFT_193108 [Cubamyces lactineus]|nr:hypothetical protein C8Q73DRAFT_193108 [Cubamyces lactineus]